MRDKSGSLGIDWALSEIQKGWDVDLVAVRLLVDDRSPDVESPLLASMVAKGVKFDVAALAGRILVERDPDRDPAFLYEYFPEFRQPPKRPSSETVGLERFRLYPPPGAHQVGFARLNRLQPVQLFTEQLESKFVLARIAAVAALGDTADLASLAPISRALVDPSWRVRRNAADSVRRLRHAGAAAVLSTHPARDGLIRCLRDRRGVVRLAAARALGSLGDVRPLQEHRAGLSWPAWRHRRDLDEVVRGEIPPLPKIWPGDETI